MNSLDLPPITELYTDMITTEKIGQRTMDDWISYQDHQQLVEEEPTYERVAVMQSVEVNTHIAAIKKELEQVNDNIFVNLLRITEYKNICPEEMNQQLSAITDSSRRLMILQSQIGKTTDGGK